MAKEYLKKKQEKELHIDKISRHNKAVSIYDVDHLTSEALNRIVQHMDINHVRSVSDFFQQLQTTHVSDKSGKSTMAFLQEDFLQVL